MDKEIKCLDSMKNKEKDYYIDPIVSINWANPDTILITPMAMRAYESLIHFNNED